MAKGLRERKPRGRPPLPPEKGKRYAVGIRTTKDLKDLLQRAADSAGRSVAQEIELRLELSFRGGGADLGPGSKQFVNSLIDAVRQRTGPHSDDWLNDYAGFHRVEEIIQQTLSGWRPDPPITAKEKQQIKEVVHAYIRAGPSQEEVQSLVRLLTRGGWPTEYRKEIEDLLLDITEKD